MGGFLGPFIRYFAGRFITCLLVIFIGVTITFLIPRLIPGSNPAETAVRRIQMMGAYLPPESVEKMRDALLKLYGLEGSVIQQYFNYWRGLLRGDLGPSFASFPTPVTSLISRSLPWTAGLLVLTATISWCVGTLLGGIAGYRGKGLWVKIVEVISNAVRPIPYYILALILLVIFAYVLRYFPTGGAFQVGLEPSLSWTFLKSVLKHGFLPALSLVVVGVGAWFINMRNLVSGVIHEGFVVFAKQMRLKESILLRNYVMKAAMPAQLTGLALQLGTVFSGTIITEIVFAYPGLGTLAFTAIMQNDYNLVMGITLCSIVAIAFATLLVDLLLPLVDPRIRYTGGAA